MRFADRLWLGTALAASGWAAVSGPAPVRACHISHHSKPAAEGLTPTPAASTHAATAPTDDFHKALQTFVKDWQQNAVPTPPPKITPTLTTTATPPAAQTLISATPPTVANQGISQPVSCPPPPPCSVPPASTSTPRDATSPASQALRPPAALLNPINPTPAPEPSAILSALAMIGAVAWRRRAARPGA